MSTCTARKNGEQGKLARIQALCQKFIEACQKNYNADSYVTINESLLPFKIKWLFKVYMSSKPGKYAIKVWSMVGVSKHYLINAHVYKGEDPNAPE